MNAPTIINAAHEVLLRAEDALSVTDVAREINGTTKPNKSQIKAAERLLKELHGLGMIEPEVRAGGVSFYWLIVAPAEVVTHNPHTGALRNPLDVESDPAGALIVPPGEPLKAAGDSEGGETDAPVIAKVDPNSGARVANFATDEDLQYLEPEDYEMPPADPALLAMANRAISEQLDEFRAQLSIIAETVAPYLPDPSDISASRAVEILDMLAEVQAEHIRTLWMDLKIADDLAGEQRRTIADLRTRAVEQAAQHKADIDRLTGELTEARDEAAHLRTENLAFNAEAVEQRINSLTADVIAARNALTNAINEADRLRAELVAERQAREALQEQAGSVDVKGAAVGYLVRVPKRAPILRRKPESARSAALSAVRAGASRAEVLAVVPVGTARRGAEWQPTEAGGVK